MRTITVMVVDDEKLIMDDFIESFDWKANGFEIVTTASNGKQALTKFKELMPQIVITDIKMPLMDGLELVKEIRKISHNTKVLLLSSYGEFEYAKEAIKYGVEEYILKTELSVKDLKEKLLTIKGIIQKENQNQSLIGEKIFQEAFTADDEFLEINSEYADKLKGVIESENIYMIIEKVVPLAIDNEMQSYLDPYASHEMISLCKTVTSADFTIKYVSNLKEGRILVLVEPLEKLSESMIYSTITSCIAQLRQVLESDTKGDYTFFVSFRKFTLSQFKSIYKSKKPLLKLKYVKKKKNMYILEDLLEEAREVYPTDRATVKKVWEVKREDFVEYIERLYGNIPVSQAGYYELLNISKILYELLKESLAKTNMIEHNINIQGDSAKNMWDNRDDVCSWFTTKYNQLINIRKEYENNRYSREVGKTMEYIGENFHSRDLKIDVIARHVGLSANRLSVIFKKETGSTVNEYITRTRILNGKRYLKETNYKMYEIAELVGYSSSQYFSSVFQSEVGITPVEYKKDKYETN